MRKFSKKIAMMMVLAMLVSMFSGIVSASAASIWSAKSVDDDHYAVVMGETIEVKKGEFIDFDLFKADEEATEAGYEYTWKSSDEEVIFIGNLTGKNGYARVKGEVGDEATITVNFKNLATGKDAERSFDVVVVEELTVEEEILPVVTVNFGEEAFVVGEEYELEAVVTVDGEEVAAEVIFYIDDEAVTTYAPAKAGEVSIDVVVVIDGKEYPCEEPIVCEVIEAVATEIVEVKQKDAKTVEITFDAKISQEEADKIQLFQGNINRSIYKKNAPAKDNVVTYTSYKDFADKTEWIFKYGDSEYKFTASLGAISYVVIDGPSVLYTEPVAGTDKKVDIQVSYYDENGVKVKSTGKDWIEWKYDSKLVGIEGNKIYGVKADDVASLYGIYHSNDFKATEGGQYAEYTYTIAPVDIIIYKSNAAAIKYVESAKVSADGGTTLIDKLPANRYGYKLFVSFKMSDGKVEKAEKFDKLSYESADESKLIVDPKSGALIPLVANDAVDVIVNNDKDMVGVVTVVIGANEVALDPQYTTYKTVSNSTGLTDAKAEFEFKNKTNYGADATFEVTSVKVLSMPGTSNEDDLKNLANSANVVKAGNKVTVYPLGLTTGNYVFEAEVKSTVPGDTQKWNKTFSVYVEDAAGNETVKSVVLFADKSEYDTTITKDTKVDAITGSAITYKLVGYNDKGVAVKEIAVSECSITVKFDNKELDTINPMLYNEADNGNIVVSGTAYKAIANGAYTIEGKYNDGSADGIKFAPVTVMVKGGQTAPAISFEKSDVEVASATAKSGLAAVLKDCFKAPDTTNNNDYKYAAPVVSIDDVKTTLADGAAAGKYVARVTAVTVTQTFEASKICVTFKVDVNKNVTVTVK